MLAPEPDPAAQLDRNGDPIPPWSRSRRERGPPSPPQQATVPYAELHSHSNFSFLDGASDPEDLIEEAVRLGLTALAITDHDGLYAVARFAEAAQGYDLATIYGAELSLGLRTPQNGVADPEGSHLLVLARGVEGYHRLAAAITEAQLRGDEKGRPLYDLDELAAAADGHWTILTGCRKGRVRQALAAGGPEAAAQELDRLTALFGHDRVVVELIDHGRPDDSTINDRLVELARVHDLPVVATNAVHYAQPRQYRLASAMAAVRARRSLPEMDGWLPVPGAHLRSGEEMARIFARYPGVVEQTVAVAADCAFNLRLAKPRLPKLEVPPGETPISWLRELTRRGAGGALPGPARDRVRAVAAGARGDRGEGLPGLLPDRARHGRLRPQARDPLPGQGIGGQLGGLLRALHHRRRPHPLRSAVRAVPVRDPRRGARHRRRLRLRPTGGGDPGGLPPVRPAQRRAGGQRDQLPTQVGGPGHGQGTRSLRRPAGRLVQADRLLGRHPGRRNEHDIPAPVVELADELLGAPRHLGIHACGMVLTERPVGEVCPIERGRMDARTVLQWDKDSCAWMGLVKFDFLGLGILSAMQYTLDLVAARLGETWTLQSLPKEEAGVYDMLCRADSIGVFQVESRAQVGTLPRLQPRKFYDLVIEIALIRPGPIQGGAVHPYIRRATGREEVTYLHEALKPVLEKTLGVPLFQEQLMQIAVAVGGCTGDDADLLRRAMGSKRGVEKIERLKAKLYAGMADARHHRARWPTRSTPGSRRSPASASPRATRSASPCSCTRARG